MIRVSGRLVYWGIVLIQVTVLTNCVADEDTTTLPGNRGATFSDALMWQQAKWLALGDSDFDSYQADDYKRRVNPDALNPGCVLSPIDVLAKDGRDVGQFAAWDDARRQDYRFNYSRSGASVRSSLFGWREKFSEDWYEGIQQVARELRSLLPGYELSLKKLMLEDLEALTRVQGMYSRPVIVQINLGINDIDGYPSMYEEFTSMNSHFSWVDTRTGVIGNTVDEILDIYPDAIVILWQLLDDGGWSTRFSKEQEQRITSHTRRWNDNLQAIADSRPGVVVFEVNTLTRELLGRKSDGTDRDINIGGTRYMRAYVPESDESGDLDNTKYILTMDGHGNTVLAAIYIREIYRLLNDEFGAGLSPLTPVSINAITCQHSGVSAKLPALKTPPDATVNHEDLPFTLGTIIAHDSSGQDISDSAVAVSDNGGVLFGDGQDLQLRSPRHGKGTHHVTVTVRDADGLSVSRTVNLVIN